VRRQPLEWEKIFASDSLDKGLISSVCKEFQKVNTKRITQIINGK
jgi:hypothetical protein